MQLRARLIRIENCWPWCSRLDPTAKGLVTEDWLACIMYYLPPGGIRQIIGKRLVAGRTSLGSMRSFGVAAPWHADFDDTI
jgi:hypothetical protein